MKAKNNIMMFLLSPIYGIFFLDCKDLHEWSIYMPDFAIYDRPSISAAAVVSDHMGSIIMYGAVIISASAISS